MPRQTPCLVPDAPIGSIDSSKFYQTPNESAMKAIRAKLTGADWCLWTYLQMLDPFGDRMKKLPSLQEMAEAIGFSAKQVQRSLLKLQRLELYEVELGEIYGRNSGGAAAKKAKERWFSADKEVSHRPSDSSQTKLSDEDKVIPQKTTLSESSPETLTVKVFQKPHTSNTYSDLLNTLSESQRESFDKFCKKKMEGCPSPIVSKQGWLNKYGAEYLKEFKEMYSESLANPQVIAPKVEPFKLVDIPFLKRMYGDGWKKAAIHHGYIIPNSPTVEIQNDSKLEPRDTPL